MSLRHKSVKVDRLSPEELNRLDQIEAIAREAEAMGLTPEQVARMKQAEEKVFIAKGPNKGKELTGGECKLVPINLDPRVGIGIVDPLRNEPIAILSKGNLFNMDGSMHPATRKRLGQ